MLLSLKVVKFDIKMYLYFSNFLRRTSAGGGGGASLGPKIRDKRRWGGGVDKIKFSPDWGSRPLKEKIPAVPK